MPQQKPRPRTVTREEMLAKLLLMRKVRVVFSLSLLVLGLFFYYFGVPGFHAKIFFLFVGFELFINQPHGFIVRNTRALNFLTFLHQLLDVALITLCIFALGGTDANFVMGIYALTIISAGLVVSIPSAFFVASLCSVSYFTMFILEALYIIQKAPIFNFSYDIKLHIIISLFIFASFFLIAAITSFLARIIIRKTEEAKLALEKLKEAERAIIQAEKLAVVGEFAAGVIHEIKNPLGIALSGVEFLEQENASNIALVLPLGKIKTGLLRANVIIHNLLDFARPSEQRLEPLDLNAVVKESAELLTENSTYAHLKNIKLRLQLAPQAIRVRLNRNQFEQVVVNILMNACDAMPKGGDIFIRTFLETYAEHGIKAGFRQTSAFVTGEKVAALEIQDEGIGIPEENLTKIFDPFFTTKSKSNTGLGLSVCRKITEAHKGEIDIKSERDKGTTVTIRMPLFGADSIAAQGGHS